MVFKKNEEQKVSITIENLLILSSDTDVEIGNDFISDLLPMENGGRKTKKVGKTNSHQR